MVLHSGLGGESGGIAAAHSIAHNLPYFPQNRAYYHGENVAFGVMTQLMLDDAQTLAQTQRITDWMIDVGLPVTLAGVGLGDVGKDALREFAACCVESPVSFFDAVPGGTTASRLLQAMLAADDYGGRRRRDKGLA